MVDVNISKDGFVFENYCNEMLPMILELYSRVSDFDNAIGRSYSLKPNQINDLNNDMIEEENNLYSLIRFSNAGLVGFVKAQIIREDKILWINSFGIVPWCRRGKLGSRSLELLLNYMKCNLGIQQVFISVMNNNSSAVKFWEYNNFRRIKNINKTNRVTACQLSVTIMKRIL